MKKILITKIFFLLLVIVLLSQSVFAWGILPARQLAELTTQEQKFSLTIMNDDFREAYFNIEFSGTLAPHARYTGGLIQLSSNQKEKTTSFNLQLPDELEPGTQTLNVILREVSSQDNSATVNSLLTLVGEVVVTVPYEGNFVSAQVAIQSVSSSKPTPITISIVNKGDDSVSVFADIIIRGPTNSVIAQWTTPMKFIDHLGVGKISTHWSDEKEPGIYLAEINLHHGDKTKVLRENFLVGSKEVISLDLSSSDFVLGEIVRLDVTALNMWNAQIENLFAEIFVFSIEGQLLQKFKTLSETIPANTKKDLTAYWDTKNLLVGNYNLNIVMNYEDGQTQKQYPVTVSLDKITVNNQLTGNVIESAGEKNQNSIFIILLLVLIGLNVAIVLYFKRMKKSGGKN